MSRLSIALHLRMSYSYHPEQSGLLVNPTGFDLSHQFHDIHAEKLKLFQTKIIGGEF